MHKNSAPLLGALCASLLASLALSVPAKAQATVTFTNASMTIDQGTSSVDFFGQIDNSAGASAFAPALEQSNGDLSSLITYYDSFGPQNNLPSSVAAGAVSSQIDFFSVDTSSLPLGTYSGSMTVSDANNSNFTAPANFSITVTPEPSACAALAVGAAGLSGLILRARRKPTV